MAGKLNDRLVKTRGEGRYDDGDGLRLVVSKTGKRSWVLRFQKDGVRRDMGLGSYPGLGLADARVKAARLRQRAMQGVDIIAEKNAPPRSLPTFREVAALVIADMQARSTNEKVKYQAARHLGPAYCETILERHVNEISTTQLAAMLRPVWREKPEVAREAVSGHSPGLRSSPCDPEGRLRDRHGEPGGLGGPQGAGVRGAEGTVARASSIAALRQDARVLCVVASARGDIG